MKGSPPPNCRFGEATYGVIRNEFCFRLRDSEEGPNPDQQLKGQASASLSTTPLRSAVEPD